MHNLYIQDQWRVIRRLTLTLGLRVENEKIPTFRRDVKDYAFQFGFGDKIAPRLGASFDVLGDGRVKVYGSWGRYFDWVKYELSRGTFGGDVWRVSIAHSTPRTLLSEQHQPARTQPLEQHRQRPGSYRDRRVPAFDLVARASSR